MKSETIGTLAKALAKVQGSLKPAIKASENPFFRSSYADLPAIYEACRALLSANDIAVIQAPMIADAEHIFLETILAHSSGEWISGIYPIKPVKPDPQSMGSAFTYARRYSLAAMVGIVAAEEDDDGAQASGTVKAPTRDEKSEALDKARAWARQAIHDINGFSADELDAWEKTVIDKRGNTNTQALVNLHRIDPDTHAKIMDAMREK